LKNNYKAHFALLVANLIYGANHLIAKGVMPNKINPSAFVFLRILGAGLLFWIIRFYAKEKIDYKDYIKLMFCGLFGVAINQLLFFHGLSLTSPIDASIIITAVPVLVLIFSAIMLKEKITTQKILGLLIGGIGAFLLIGYSKKVDGNSSILGNVLVFINAISYAFYLVYVKPLMKKYKPITVISWAFLFGFIFIIPIGFRNFLETNYYAFDLKTYLTIAFVILGTTFLTYLLNIYALSKVTPTISGSYIYLQPVISFIMVAIYAFVLGHNEYAHDINMVKIISCFLVVLGVYLVSKSPKKQLI
jgi:drug/metabolite transporter (DMT)-like permease